MQDGRDVWWHDIVDRQSEDCPPVPLDSEHMLYLLYTSGTTAKPKGILHTTAGYLLGVSFTHEMVFDIKPDDVYWCAADIGWVTGHSYIVYGPLANATTSVLYEGAPDTPVLGTLVADHRGLQGLDPVLRADRHPGLHEAGRAVRRRSTTCRRCACSARSASRSTPRRGSGTASTSAASKAPDRRHVVADRDRPDPDHAAPRGDRHETGVGDVPVPGHRGGRRRRRRELRAARRWRVPRPEAPVAGDAARHLRRPGALPADVLEPLPRHVLRGRRRKARPRRLPVAARSRRRRDERRRATGSRRPRWSPRWSTTSHVAEAAVVGKKDDDHRAGDLRVRHPQGRTRRPSDALAVELREHVAEGHRPDRPPEVPDVRRRTCPRRDRARSCAACCATSPRAGPWATPRRSPMAASSRPSASTPARRRSDVPFDFLKRRRKPPATAATADAPRVGRGEGIPFDGADRGVAAGRADARRRPAVRRAQQARTDRDHRCPAGRRSTGPRRSRRHRVSSRSIRTTSILVLAGEDIAARR